MGQKAFACFCMFLKLLINLYFQVLGSGEKITGYTTQTNQEFWYFFFAPRHSIQRSDPRTHSATPRFLELNERRGCSKPSSGRGSKMMGISECVYKSFYIPIRSMSDIFKYNWLMFMVNVGK